MMTTYGGQEATAWRLIDAQEQTHKCNHIILDKRLIEQSVQHGGTEDRAGGKG